MNYGLTQLLNLRGIVRPVIASIDHLALTGATVARVNFLKSWAAERDSKRITIPSGSPGKYQVSLKGMAATGDATVVDAGAVSGCAIMWQIITGFVEIPEALGSAEGVESCGVQGEAKPPDNGSYKTGYKGSWLLTPKYTDMAYELLGYGIDNGSSGDSCRMEALESKIDNLMRSRGSSASEQNPRSHEGSNPTPPPGCSDDVVDAGFLTLEESAGLLELYKSSMTLHFPFVVVPPHTTAEALRREKPFLFLSILAVTSFSNVRLQRKLCHVVMDRVTMRLFSGEKLSLDLLQGILVYIACIVLDARYDRAPLGSWNSDVGGQHGPIIFQGVPRGRVADEQRAAAGCVYLATTVSRFYQKTNTMPCTPYIEQCCFVLSQECEYPTDRLLHGLIRLQLLLGRAEPAALNYPGREAAVAAIVNAHTEIERFWLDLPGDLRENYTLYMQCRTAEILLCQYAIFDRSLPFDAVVHKKLTCLGFSAAKSMLQFIISLPRGAERCFNNTEGIQIGFALTVAARLILSFTDSVTDPEIHAAQQSLNLSHLLHHLCHRIEDLATNEVDDYGDRDTFSQYSQRLRRIQTWYERSRIHGAEVGSEPYGPVPNPTAMPMEEVPESRNPESSYPPIPVPEINVVPPLDSQFVPSDPFWSEIAQWGTPGQQMVAMFPEFGSFFHDWDWSSTPSPYNT
ncbi:hypothetical protein F4778DRAFT_775468 [Xylariomycetidae sp. FL2044]|nr:hypothetical protein F4778DRAFT_775468 [Xylariomycetidae sp. FL2044]